jgi:choline-sulfatase
VPLIIAGDGIPQGRAVDTVTTLLDVYPFIMDCVGEGDAGMVDPDHPGISIARLAGGEQPDRTVLSEYHGMGSTTGAFAIRHGRFKYIHYVKYRPQLFDLANDPDERQDLAGNVGFAEVLAESESKLRALLSPEAVDRRARERQAQQLERYGGRAAVIERGDLGFSPPPGIRPIFE